MPNRIDGPGGTRHRNPGIARHRQNPNRPADGFLMLAVLFEPQRDHRLHPPAEARFRQPGGRFLHPPVGPIAERGDHVGDTQRKQQIDLVGRHPRVHQPHRQGLAGPAIERHMRQHGLNRGIALQTAFGMVHRAASWAALFSSSLNPNRLKSFIRMVYRMPSRWSYSCCTTRA